jgi:hypothetical protein
MEVSLMTVPKKNFPSDDEGKNQIYGVIKSAGNTSCTADMTTSLNTGYGKNYDQSTI